MYYDPTRYLSTNVGRFDLSDDIGTAWYMQRENYVEKYVSAVFDKLNESERKPDVKADSVMCTGYRP